MSINKGCKTDYHISKNYNENEDGKLLESDEMYRKRIKGMGCKQLGHFIEDGPVDPNYRTKFSIFDEFFRVEGLKDIITKHTGMNVLSKTEKLFKAMIPIKDFSPFKRGVMLFADYNYQYFNKVVLPPLEELIDEEDKSSNESDKISKSYHGSEDDEQQDEDHTFDK